MQPRPGSRRAKPRLSTTMLLRTKKKQILLPKKQIKRGRMPLGRRLATEKRKRVQTRLSTRQKQRFQNRTQASAQPRVRLPRPMRMPRRLLSERQQRKSRQQSSPKSSRPNAQLLQKLQLTWSLLKEPKHPWYVLERLLQLPKLLWR